MALSAPVTKREEQQRLEEERQARASLSRVSSEARAAEEKEKVFLEQRERQEADILRESQRRAMLVQEEVAESEREQEMAGGTGELKVKRESVSIFSYSGALMVACFKDLMDFTIVLALPILGVLVSFCCTVLIFLLLFFPKRRYKIASNMRLAIIDACILLGLIPIEGIAFPFNLLPFTVAAVGMIYILDKKFVAARNAKRFDRKGMKKKLSSVIRQVSVDKNAASRRLQENWNTPEAA